MTTLETSTIRPAEKTTTAAAARATAKRPWYSWLSAIAAALVGLYYLYFLAITPATNLFAFAWLAAIVLGCFAAATGFALNRVGAKCLLVAVVLILPRLAFNLYTVYAITSAGYSSGFAIRLLGSLITAAISLYTALLSGITLAAMWRSSERFAWAALVLLLVPVLFGLAIIPPALLRP